MTEVVQRPSRVRRLAVVGIVGGILAMWGFVLYLAFFVGRADSPDKIEEPAFLEAAEQRCAAALADVALLPRADSQRGDPVGRADTVTTATETFTIMVADLRALPLGDPEAADLVRQWLDDWDTLLADRFDYAMRLRVDPEARLLVTPGPNGRQVSLQIDEFAATNDMPSCKSPLDA